MLYEDAPHIFQVPRATRNSFEHDNVLSGGETTVTVGGSGKGGRNQELALSAAFGLRGCPGVLLAAFATDGIDGATDAAGGYASAVTLQKGRAAGLDPSLALERNDSNTFLAAAGDLIVTGPTGTNVNDVVFALICRAEA